MSAGTTGVIVVLIFVFLGGESSGFLARVGGSALLSGGAWHPTQGRFDLTAMLLGSLLATIGAVLVAAPLGVVSAVYCEFYAPPWTARVYTRIIELLAGIPSVVFGLWGLTVLVPLIAKVRPPGASLLAGIVILTLMILPTITLLCRATLANVPRSYLDAAAAVGLSRYATVRSIALPAARSGLSTAIILGTGRALGETMAILMVCGNVARVPASVFDPIRTLTANIALEMGYALGDHRASLFASGLALMIMATLLVLVAQRVSRGPVHG